MQFFKRFARPRTRRTATSYRARPGVEALETRLTPSLPPYIPINVSAQLAGASQTSASGAESTAVSSTGEYVVTWANEDSTGTWGVYASAVSSSGTLISKARISSTTGGNKLDPAVAMGSAGDYVVTWSSYGEDGCGWGVYAERFNAAGVAQGGQFRVNTTTCGDQNDARIGMDSQGNFVVAWTGNGCEGWGVYAQRFNAQGQRLGGEFEVNTNSKGDKEYVSVAMNGAGNFVVSWSSYGQDGCGWGVYAQRYNCQGIAQGCEFRVNTTTAGDQMYSSVAMDALGDFVITWSSNGQDGSGWGVYAQRYNSLGCAAGGEFLVNTTTAGDQMYSSVAMDASGNFTITWSSNSYDGHGWGVYGRQYTAAGTSYGSQFQISAGNAGNEQFASIAMNSAGQAVIGWTASGSSSTPTGVYDASVQLL
jgi:hypothetical protein